MVPVSRSVEGSARSRDKTVSPTMPATMVSTGSGRHYKNDQEGERIPAAISRATSTPGAEWRAVHGRNHRPPRDHLSVRRSGTISRATIGSPRLSAIHSLVGAKHGDSCPRSEAAHRRAQRDHECGEDHHGQSGRWRDRSPNTLGRQAGKRKPTSRLTKKSDRSGLAVVTLRVISGFEDLSLLARVRTPHMRYLFVRPALCLQLPSDPKSPWTALLFG